MNRMRFEKIKHNAAQKVFEGTEYYWADMLDNTEWFEKEVKRHPEEEQEDLWIGYFEEMLEDYRAEDSKEWE